MLIEEFCPDGIFPKEIALMGNLNPVKIFLQSTPNEVTEATRSLKESMKDTDNFILSSGCDIPLNTLLEKIEAFMKAGCTGIDNYYFNFLFL